MPRGFTTVEKERIREKLMEAGRNCFLRYGLKKTTIEDLTAAAEIAKASFYLFFDSKEALYAEIMFREMPAMMKRLAAASYEKCDDAREALVLFMQALVREIETNPFSKVIIDQANELERLARALDFEEILERAQSLFVPIYEWFVEKQNEGQIISGDPQELIYALALIKLLPINRDRIPERLYTQMLELIPRVIADGLTCPARKGVG